MFLSKTVASLESAPRTISQNGGIAGMNYAIISSYKESYRGAHVLLILFERVEEKR